MRLPGSVLAFPTARRVACGRATCHSRVVGESKGAIALRDGGKAAQLKGRAVQLAVQAGQAQAGFGIGQLDQFLAVLLQRRRQGSEQVGAAGAIAGLPVVKSLTGFVDGRVQFGGGGGGQGCAIGLAGAGVEGLESGHGVLQMEKKRDQAVASKLAVVQRRACSLSDTPKPGKVGTSMRPSWIWMRSLNSGSSHSKCSTQGSVL